LEDLASANMPADAEANAARHREDAAVDAGDAPRLQDFLWQTTFQKAL
jgi:hypothetical protein